MTQQANEISVFTNSSALSEHIAGYRDSLDDSVAALAGLGPGAYRFAGAIFPGAGADRIYAQRNEREAEGRGPHFDIYNEGLDQEYPWLGVYNLAGTCAVSAALMPEGLADEYAALYPKPTANAHTARRYFGALVLGSDVITVYTGTLKSNMGLVLPQRREGPPIIHEVVPEDITDPGSFIKLVVPKNNKRVHKSLGTQGFMLLDELLTMSIGTEEGSSQKASDATPDRHRRIAPNFSDGASSSLSAGLLD